MSAGSVKSDAAQIVDAAMALRRLLFSASDEVLYHAQGIINTRACSSDFASTHEPLAFIGQALGAEFAQRILAVADVAECDDVNAFEDAWDRAEARDE